LEKMVLGSGHHIVITNDHLLFHYYLLPIVLTDFYIL